MKSVGMRRSREVAPGGRSDLIVVRSLASIALFGLLIAGNAFAAHPLITDDTGTQGKGASQIEVNAELSYDREKSGGVSARQTGWEVSAVFSHGITDNLDVVVGLPYQQFRIREDGDVAAKEHGISDVSLEAKWRFYEKEGLSLALKPGITLPTADEEKGLGNGEISYGLTFIATKEMEPLVLHVNIGYLRNGYKLREDREENRRDIWHASLAAEASVGKDVRLVANVGIERNGDRTSTNHPSFILGGAIYSLSESVDLDFGIKAGLNEPETDRAILAGIAWRF